MSSSGQAAGPALDWNPFPVAVHVFSRHRRVLKRKSDIIRDEQVKVPIPVVVEKTTSRTPARLIVPWLPIPKPGGLGDVGERSISVVPVKAILPEVSAKDVLKSIVVVISDAYA